MAFRKVCAFASLLWLFSFNLAEACRLALVLAIDVSSSVDGPEYELQREGLARALRAPEVVRAFLASDPVALYAFEWSDQTSQHALLPGWQMVGSEEDLVWIAALIAESPGRRTDQAYVRTATGTALAHAARMLAEGPECQTRTVNVSSNGTNNDGVEPREVYASFPFEDVTVNALIMVRRGADDGSRGDWMRYRRYSRLVAWFQREILHGPRAFWVSAENFEDFERAMRVKLLRELELPPLSGRPLTANAG
jgi:hypothetical protein